MQQPKLPRGIWYEADKRRYRVRRYRNKVTFHAGYYKTLEAAIAALARLDERLNGIPKARRRRGGREPAAEVPTGTFRGVSTALRKSKERDPSAARVPKHKK